MFVDTVDQCVRLVRPRSFAALMTLYEGNHTRLRQLLGNLHCLPEALASSSPDDFRIYVMRGAASRYTSDLYMSYWLRVDGHHQAMPDLLLRVYHDARLVETLDCDARLKRKFSASAGAGSLPHRWPLNILLNKWLEYCLDHRHKFTPARAGLHPVRLRGSQG